MLYENLLVWMDDIVFFNKTEGEFMHKFYARVFEYGLSLNANKNCLRLREVSWCGRLIDGEGVRLDPERVLSLRALPLLANGDLQKLLCAATGSARLSSTTHRRTSLCGPSWTLPSRVAAASSATPKASISSGRAKTNISTALSLTVWRTRGSSSSPMMKPRCECVRTRPTVGGG